MSDDLKKKEEFPIVIQLQKPVTSGDKTIDEISVTREPVGADWQGFPIQGGSIGDFQRVAARVCNCDMVIIRKLSMPDTMRLVEVLSDFFG